MKLINARCKTEDKARYRIFTDSGKVKFAGTDKHSWLTREEALKLVDRKTGEKVMEFNVGVSTTRPLWEVL